MKLLRHNCGAWMRSGIESWHDVENLADVHLLDCYQVSAMPPLGNVVNVGAHGGYFALKVKRHFPAANIVCVEPSPEHLDCLRANVGSFATIIQATCAYATDETPQFPVATQLITLEEVMEQMGWACIDLLQVRGCGAATRILETTPSLDLIQKIVGEYHSRSAWLRLVTQRFSAWKSELLRDGEAGLFRLTHP